MNYLIRYAALYGTTKKGSARAWLYITPPVQSILTSAVAEAGGWPGGVCPIRVK